MTKQEMLEHIKVLTEIIKKQLGDNEHLQRRLHSAERQLSVLHFQIGKLEGKKDE